MVTEFNARMYINWCCPNGGSPLPNPETLDEPTKDDDNDGDESENDDCADAVWATSALAVLLLLLPPPSNCQCPSMPMELLV